MIDLVRSRHLRAKIACLVLFCYIIFHSSGLIFLIARYSESYSYIQWSDPTFWAILSSIVFQSTASAIWLYLIFIIVFTHRLYYTDTKWQQHIKKLSIISVIFYCIGILLLIIEAIHLEAFWWEIYLVFMNKTFVLMLIFNIYYDLNLKKRRQQRMLLYGEILECYSLCHALFLSIVYLYYLLSVSWLQWLVFVPMTCFWSIFSVSFQYSFLGQKLCKKHFDMERLTNETTSRECCPYGPMIVVWHLIGPSTLLLLLSAIFFNDNTCLSYNNAFENIFGIRGYAFLNFYYAVMMSIEFIYGGLPNNVQSNQEEIVANVEKGVVATPVIPTDALL